MSRYTSIQVEDLIDANGESAVEAALGSYRSPRNDEVETFLREKALDFTKRHLSVSYLVFDDATMDFVGYFSVTHKPIEIPANALSKTQQRRMAQFCHLDEDRGSFLVSAFLIAQFGKNFAIPEERRISGVELMALVFNFLKEEQRRIGGLVAFLEFEESNQFLRSFYAERGFHIFGNRTSETDGIRYGQMFAFVK